MAIYPKRKVTHMAFSLHGVHVPPKKNTEGMTPVYMPPPATVTLHTAMHIGTPAIPCVKIGDHVDVGTVIAHPDGAVSAPVHASVSGKVSAIRDVTLANGRRVPGIVITSDGEMTKDPGIQPPTVNSKEDFIKALETSGIVGLGGAGFPTYVKYASDNPGVIEELIVNGAECEPYITSDSVTMANKAEDIAYALTRMQELFGFQKIIIAIENNKKAGIAAMEAICLQIPGASVKVLPEMYPQGGEKVLIYHTTGKVVPEGGLPSHVGCIVSNSSTVAEIGCFLKTGMPLVNRCITVDGSAVKSPKNVVAPVGTSLRDLLDFAGGLQDEAVKVMYGGPMMGIAVPDLDVPVLKNTNAVLAFGKGDAILPKPTPCIRCGACTNHCPFGINPAAIAKAYKAEDVEELDRLGATLCMECGCCSYICPAHRPLTETNRLAKRAVRRANARKETQA